MTSAATTLASSANRLGARGVLVDVARGRLVVRSVDGVHVRQPLSRAAARDEPLERHPERGRQAARGVVGQAPSAVLVPQRVDVLRREPGPPRELAPAQAARLHGFGESGLPVGHDLTLPGVPGSATSMPTTETVDNFSFSTQPWCMTQPKLRLETAGRSVTGNVRGHNEDVVLVAPIGPRSAWLAVCDGMGGAAGGEVASAVTANVIASAVADGVPVEVGGRVARALQTASEALRAMGDREPRYRGMGTTATVLAVTSELEAVIGQVGDSRAYLLRGAHFVQLTRDQTLVQLMVEKGPAAPRRGARRPVREHRDASDRRHGGPAGRSEAHLPPLGRRPALVLRRPLGRPCRTTRSRRCCARSTSRAWPATR
jgi:hypothetical protein